MKKIITLTLVAMFTIALRQAQNSTYGPTYEVVKTRKPINIDANWDKKQWKKVKPITITYLLRDRVVPHFMPEAQVKMTYDKNNVYIIFRVKDKYVRCVTDRINGPVWRDSAVEFFFSPDAANPLNFFNLETNCGGTPLMQFHANNAEGRRESKRLSEEDILQIEIVASMPKIVDPEITEDTVWTIEYRVPIAMLQQHSAITTPAKGVRWKANFYKIAEITSNPHYITWSEIDLPRPQFHAPQFFGTIIFK